MTINSLPNLQKLVWLESVKLTRFELNCNLLPIKQLKNLELWACSVPISCFEQLVEKCRSLESLGIVSCDTESVELVGKLLSLKILSLRNNGTPDFRFVSELHRLESLSIFEPTSYVVEVGSSKLYNLYLDSSNNKVDVRLKCKVSLDVLGIADAKIEELAFLSNVEKLDEIQLRRGQFSEKFENSIRAKYSGVRFWYLRNE